MDNCDLLLYSIVLSQIWAAVLIAKRQICYVAFKRINNILPGWYQ